MQIAVNKVALFHYRLRDEVSQQEIDNSYASDPVAYLHGFANIIPGLERAMLGRQSGDVFSVSIQAKDAYGERVQAAQQRVPIKHLHVKKHTKLNVGDVVTLQTSEGPRQVSIVKPGKFTVDIDANHPLAGRDLLFDIEIVDVREASEQEIAHKHAHGVGGHQH